MPTLSTALSRRALGVALAVAMCFGAAFATQAGAETRAEVQLSGALLKVVPTSTAAQSDSVELTDLDGGGVSVHDPDGVLAGPGCVAVSDETVDCAPDGIESIRFDAGGGADSLVAKTSLPTIYDGGAGDDVYADDAESLVPTEVSYRGGGGTDRATFAAAPGPVMLSKDGTANDGRVLPQEGVQIDRDNILGDVEVLIGSAFFDYLEGGAGSDVLFGGADNDGLFGGGGDDTFQMGSSRDGDDIVFGGSGSDLVSYAGRTKPLVVNLTDGANDGEPGEQDQVLGVEQVDGGSGDDRIEADLTWRFRLTLRGNGGDDVLLAGDAADELTGGAGADLIRGYGGSDTLLAIDGESDYVDCGTETDSAFLDEMDLFDECEPASPTPSDER